MSFQISTLIEKMDAESKELLTREREPEEIAILIMLHQKHSDLITMNASHKNWTWKEGTLRTEFNERIEFLNQKVQSDSIHKFYYMYILVFLPGYQNVLGLSL